MLKITELMTSMNNSGFKTDLTLLNTGRMWAWTVCIIVVAFASKFFSSGGVAKAFGMTWRESSAVGSLMGQLS